MDNHQKNQPSDKTSEILSQLKRLSTQKNASKDPSIEVLEKLTQLEEDLSRESSSFSRGANAKTPQTADLQESSHASNPESPGLDDLFNRIVHSAPTNSASDSEDYKPAFLSNNSSAQQSTLPTAPSALAKKWGVNGPKVPFRSVSKLFHDQDEEEYAAPESPEEEYYQDDYNKNKYRESEYGNAKNNEERDERGNPEETHSQRFQQPVSFSQTNEPSHSSVFEANTTNCSKKQPATSSQASVSTDNLMVVSGLKKGYIKGKKLIPVLQGIDISVHKGEFLSIVGQSGSGKSTLLHLMGTLDLPDEGTIHFDGQRIDNLASTQRDILRNRYIGMIFQFYHLLPEMTMLENVLSPLMIRESFFGYLGKRKKYVEQAKYLLNLVGLTHRMKHKPRELSGGEMQRSSIARALITMPRILLADEPTGNLDSKTSLEIIRLLRKLNEEQNLTIVMVTHDLPQAEDSDRIIRLVDGRVAEIASTASLSF